MSADLRGVDKVIRVKIECNEVVLMLLNSVIFFGLLLVASVSASLSTKVIKIN